MRYSPEHKEETRRRILKAVGRGFRKEGLGGIGIDGLARGASLTSGAFYGHFRSKAEAFREAVVTGLDELTHGVEAFQAKYGEGWLEAFAEFYFTDRVTCDLADGCALPSLSPDVVRADAKTKAAFEKELLATVAAMAKGLAGRSAEEREARAIVLLALFVGGVTLARAVQQRSWRDRIAGAVREAAIALGRADELAPRQPR